MDTVLRLLLRFIVVPLGYLAGVATGIVVLALSPSSSAAVIPSEDPYVALVQLFGALLAGPIMYFILTLTMWLPSSIGILISEVLAVRSWIFHALNGAISAWIGWQMFVPFSDVNASMNETTLVFAAGLAGGFAYWAVAGWSAGFWKPVFARPLPPPALPPANNPFSPPARTEA